MLAGQTLTPDMAPLSRWERLQLAALRLREIQSEADAIYRSFPELDRRPKINRTAVRTKPDQSAERSRRDLASEVSLTAGPK